MRTVPVSALADSGDGPALAPAFAPFPEPPPCALSFNLLTLSPTERPEVWLPGFIYPPHQKFNSPIPTQKTPSLYTSINRVDFSCEAKQSSVFNSKPSSPGEFWARECGEGVVKLIIYYPYMV